MWPRRELAVALLALAAMGCEETVATGVMHSDMPLTSEMVEELGPNEGVRDMESVSGEIIVLTSRRAIWYDSRGQRRREVELLKNGEKFDTAAGIYYSERYGLCFYGPVDRTIRVYDDSGRLVSTFNGNDYSVVRAADILGDPSPEFLLERVGRGADMRNRTGVAVFDQSGKPLADFRSEFYLTDFGAVPKAGGGEGRLILYAYPDQDRGGVFSVMTPEQQVLRTWQVSPPPAGFKVGDWLGQTFVYFLQRNEFVFQSLQGEEITRLPAPQGEVLSRAFGSKLAGGYQVMVATGLKPPQHIVYVYNPQGQIIFQEVANQTVYGLTALDAGDKPALLVAAETRIWKYVARP